MTDITPVGSPMFPVDRMARLLLVCARQDRRLLARSSNQQSDDKHDRPFDLPALFHWRPDLARSDQSFGGELYLEELVSLAAEAAERAGDASRQAADATVALRHGRVAFAVVGAVGMLIGLAGAAGAVWNGAERQSRVAGELTAVRTLQHRADQQLVAMVAAQNHTVPLVQTAAAAPPVAAAQTADAAPRAADAAPHSAAIASQTADAAPHSAAIAPQTADAAPPSTAAAPRIAAVEPLPRLHAITVATRQEWSATPVDVPRSEAHAATWTPPARAWAHKRRRPVRRVYRYYRYYRYYPTPRPPVILVRVVQNIQRDVGALFR